MDTHDGNIIQYSRGGFYYYYSMGYQNCTIEHGTIPPQECPGIYIAFGQCGFRVDHDLKVYKSSDLISWVLVSENALPLDSRPYGIYFRPKVIFNSRTERYVLWINHLSNATTPLAAYPDAAYIVASSSSPDGPFEIINEHANVAYQGAGDFSLMQDPSNPSTAYIAYDSWETDHTITVEQLTADFTDSMGLKSSSGLISQTNVEAPVLFQHGDYYYLLFGHICCFCKEGGGAELWVSSHPLGPWESTGVELNPNKDGSLYHVIPTQNSFVFPVVLADHSTVLVFAGDLWSSAQDNLKSHDLQFWQPLEFDQDSNPPTIKPFEWRDWFVLDLY